MAWTNAQKGRVKQYQGYCEMTDIDYRALLIKFTGCSSSKHQSLTQWHFDHVMAAIEAVLDYRVAEGFVNAPYGKDLGYWRNRLPKEGFANSRQVHEINDWWYKLQPYLEPDQRTIDYRNGIISGACRCRFNDALSGLHSWQAGLAIEAFKDRLRWALKKRPDLAESGADQTPTTAVDFPAQEYAQEQPEPAPVPVETLHQEEEVPF